MVRSADTKFGGTVTDCTTMGRDLQFRLNGTVFGIYRSTPPLVDGNYVEGHAVMGKPLFHRRGDPMFIVKDMQIRESKDGDVRHRYLSERL